MAKKSEQTKTKTQKFQDIVVAESLSFYCCDGKRLYSLTELCLALDNMQDGVFSYHVNTEKNDFHNWVRDVFKLDEIAKSILKVKNKKIMKLKIKRLLA
jgi:hypothetical protein